MGFSGISIWQLLIVALIIVLLFGTKKLRGLGSDLGSAVKGFRGAMTEGEQEAKKAEDAQAQPQQQAKLSENEAGRVIDSEAAQSKDEKKV